MSSQPHLSIFIPTYNRAGFLEANLARLAAMGFPFSVEIVVSDNASTDRTPQVAFDAARIIPNLRYLRQDRNVGMTANYLAACRMATGKFLLYLGDDDSVFPAEVIAAVAAVEADPDLAVLYSPHEYWDFRSGARYGQHWAVAQDTFFTRPQAGELLNFVVDHHINPEIGIYRTETLQRVLRTHDGAYWAYTVLAALVAEHKVGFSTRSYYKFDSRPETSGINANSGRRIVVNAYHEIRTGLEYFVAKIYEMAGQVPLPLEDARHWRERIDNFVLAGIADTFLAQILACDFLGAHDLARRLEGGGRTPYDLILRLEPNFETKLVADFVLHSCTAMSWVDTLLVHCTTPLANVILALAKARPGLNAVIATTGDLQSPARPQATAVLTDRGFSRPALIDQGYLSGLVFAEDEIRKFLSLSAPRVKAAAGA